MIKRLSAALLVALVAVGPGVAIAAAQDPMVAPATSLSGDGRAVSGAGKTLSAAQVSGLAAAGQSIRITGSGYDVDKGVYVSLCVIPATNHAPTPCGGGVDKTGASEASAWVSSNPPTYAAGLTIPYGDGGSFDVTVTVRPEINAQFDCFAVRCALVTRNDHTRSSDRSQDLFLPVTFSTGSGPVVTPPTATPSTAPATGASTSTTSAPAVTSPPRSAPVAQLAADGRRLSDGTRTLAASDTAGLDPDDAVVTVTGEGFDPAQGIYLALCVIPAAGATPGPCSTGTGRATWVSSSPPDYGKDLARPFADGGRFEVELHVPASIDATHDCRELPCAITTRSDDTAAGDRGNDLLLPVSFGEATRSDGDEERVDDDRAAVVSDEDSGGAGVAVALAGGAGVLALAAVGARQLRRRSSSPDEPTP